jgi:hypothetical protein
MMSNPTFLTAGIAKSAGHLRESPKPDRQRLRLPMAGLFLVVALAWTTAASAASRDKVNYESYNGFMMPPTPVLPRRESHPSLWFASTNDIAALCQKRDADDYSRRLWQQISHDPLLQGPLPSVPVGGGEAFHQYYGNMSKLAKINALMSILGEESRRETFRARAVEALKRAYDGPIYETTSKKGAKGMGDIYRAVWAQNFCAAYDWVQPYLSAADDQAIRQRLAKEAQTIYDNLYVWTDRPHNHRSKPAWALGTMALTLSSHPQAREWLARSLKAANENTKYFFSADGIYREGPHYLLFSALNFIPFLYHYRNVAGVDGFPVFQPAFEAVVATRNSEGWLPNLYDSYLRPFPTHMVAKPYLSRATWLNPEASLGHVLQWNFCNTDFGVFQRAMAKSGYNYTGATLDYTLEVDEFLTYEPAVQPIAPSASPTLFLKGGQTVFRNRWSFNEAAQRYLLFQGVAAADNHFHYDHLSFVIQAENQMMASDSGYSRGDYNDAIRKEWYITPAAHNVVTANGFAPVDPGENVTPVSRDNLDTDFFDFEEKEAPYPGRAVQHRAIAFPGEEYFVVIDQLSSPQPADYVLYLHGGRGEMSGDGIRRVWTYTNDLFGAAARMAAWVLPGGATLSDRKGELTYIKGDYAEFGYVSAAQRASNATFMQIIIPLAANSPLPHVSDLSGQSVIAATVEKDGTLDTFAARRGDTPVRAGKLETDAGFAWVRSRAAAAEWAMQQGTVLTHDGVDLVKSTVPITIAGRAGPASLEAAINTVSTNYTLALPTQKNARLKSICFNGAKADAQVKGDRLSIKLKGSGRLAVEFFAGD